MRATYPQVDKLRLIAVLRDEHFPDKPGFKSSLLTNVKALGNGLLGFQNSLGPTIGYGNDDNVRYEIRLPLGERGSIVLVQIYVGKQEGSPFMISLEMNPRKLKASDCSQLQNGFENAGIGAFDFGRLIADARITRLDLAIDYLDLLPREVLATAKGEGKRVLYLGDDGELETIQVHRFKQKLPDGKIPRKRLGKLIVKIYDRNRERAFKKKPPPWPGRNLTRAEVKCEGFKTGNGFLTLSQLKLPFAKVSLSLAAKVSGGGRMWRAYCAMRRSTGPDDALALTGGKHFKPSFLEQRYQAHSSNLLSKKVWKPWLDHQQGTAFGYLIAAAKASEDKAVPQGD